MLQLSTRWINKHEVHWAAYVWTSSLALRAKECHAVAQVFNSVSYISAKNIHSLQNGWLIQNQFVNRRIPVLEGEFSKQS